jgi:hypothetical protein
MSHQSTGYFYYEYTYEPEYYYKPGSEPQPNQSGKDESRIRPFRTAYYTKNRQDHKAQTDWYKNKVRPAIVKDCTKFIDIYNGTNLHQYPEQAPDRKPNRFGRVYRPFDWNCVKEEEFKWTSGLPPTTEGDQKKQPYGREI